MLIQIGYELVFNCAQKTPMILMVNVHYARASDMVTPDHPITDPETSIKAYRDGFGNWCTRIVALMGMICLRSNGVVRDSAQTDVLTPSAQPHLLQDLPDPGVSVGQRVLRDRSSVQRSMVAIWPVDTGMGASAGDLRFCGQPHRFRLSERRAQQGGLARPE